MMNKFILAFFIMSGTSLYLQITLDRRFCYSPFEIVRRFNIVSLVLAPTPHLQMLWLDVVEILSFMLYLRKSNLKKAQSLVYFVGLSYIAFLCLSLASSSAMFYGVESHALWISHLFQDCSSGSHLLTLPGIVWILWQKQFKIKDTWNLCLVLSAGASTLGILMFPENCIASVFSIVSPSLLLLIVLPIIHKLKFCSSINLISIEDIEIRKYYKIYIPYVIIFIFLLVREIGIIRTRIHASSHTEVFHISIGIHTVARKDNPRYLSITLESFLEQFPHNPKDSAYKGHLHIYPISFDGTENNVVYHNIKEMMERNQMSRNYVSFAQGAEALEMLKVSSPNLRRISKLRLHVAVTLNYVFSRSTSHWIMIHEDDFQLCEGKWTWFIHALTKVTRKDSSYCGFFVATGGAGIVIRRDVVPSVISALLDKEISEPADIILQDCLRGRYSTYCQACKSENPQLLISSHLIFRHIGFTSSLSHDYDEKEGRWSCGWRHPFNGDPDVDTIHTDTFP